MPNSSEKTNKTNRSRTRGVTKAELLVAILSAKNLKDRVFAIRTLAPSKAVARKAFDELSSNPDVRNALEKYASEQGFEFTRRGRHAPRVGETRVYNVQQIKGDATFIRLPLTPLEVGKGKQVKVAFEEDEIVVRVCS